jgi:Domain of unknown function (DUF5916)/Carbohydrate family 9 binding domain-like
LNDAEILRARVVFVVCLLVGSHVQAQQTSRDEPQHAVTAIRTAAPPLLDGRLSEPIWSQAPPITGFTQRDPDEGREATEPTEIRILYDDDAIYIGARMVDSNAQAIASRLSNRDEIPDADYVAIYLDPRHDHFTGAEFVVSVAGVQRDLVISNDTNEDDTWDAVWDSAVSVDELGWTAELRIPFSQLRFSSGTTMWGVNASRFIRRKAETDWFERVPKSENGLASRMAHLVGMVGVAPGRHLEIVPYVASREEMVAPDKPGNPFNDGSRLIGSTGVDLKMRVTDSMTLDATINPDFGQAEVDPAVVNLSAFETFFQEKRRFFIEGSEIFNSFGQGGSNNFFGFNTSDPEIFYSRRIGRAPEGESSGDFVDRPAATTILGAVKLTGKTTRGWSVGLIEAVTSEEQARVVTGPARTRLAVEPAANYFVGRLKRDFSRGGVGMIATSAVHALGNSELRNLLSRRSWVTGGDGYFFFDRKREWVVTGKLSRSRVTGTQAAIARAQLSAQHYFQRPDAPEISYDPQRTSLGGFAGRVNLNRNAGNVKINAALWGVSPGFEANDLGFLGSTDRAGGHVVLLLQKPTVDRFTRYRHIWFGKWWAWNFNRKLQGNGLFICGTATFLNYWSANSCGGPFWRTQNDQLTRGGPTMVNAGGRNWNGEVSTDARKPISINISGGGDWNEFSGYKNSGAISISLKPLPSLTISSGPDLTRSRDVAQYVQTEPDSTAQATYGHRYVFGTIDQTQLTLTTRVTWALTPRASLRAFVQPLLATGAYGDFKELARPATFDFLHYGGSVSTLGYDPVARAYTVDPDAGGPAQPFSFQNPDFNFKSLRLNAVFRWEFRPGSNLYVVWTSQREDLTRPGIFRAGRDLSTLFRAPSNDIVLVKMAYWMGR